MVESIGACVVRLKSLRLTRFGPFEYQEIELAPLTILFGPNGVGKSTVLNAVEDALTLSGGRRYLEVQEETVTGSAVVYATLDDRLTPGSSDERIMRHVLWKNLKRIDDSVLSLKDPFKECPPLDQLLVLKATQMIESGTQGTPEARARIAAHLLGYSVLAFGGLQGEEEGNWGLVCFASLHEVAQYAETFDTSVLSDSNHDYRDEDDEILQAVSVLKNGEDAIVTMEWGEPEWELSNGRNSSKAASGTLFGKIRPLPMRLDFEPETLDLELEEYVHQIAARLYSSGRIVNNVPWLIVSHPPAYEALFEPINDNDVGLEQVRDAPSPFSAMSTFRFIPREFDEYVVSPWIRSAVERIASHANLIAPKFLVQDSQIEIEILNPSRWKPQAPRLRTTMNQGGKKIPLARVGSGIARWASYSIRLACQELLNGTVIGDPDIEAKVIQALGGTYLVEEDAAATYAKVAALEVLPANLDVVLLIDEPEAHLHPRAVASVGEWLLEISPRVAAVVVATHHPSLFNLRSPSTQKHVVLRSGKRDLSSGRWTSISEPWDPASEDLVAQLASDIGLTPGDLFMMSRYVLFVEGPHDLAILEEFFGDVLRGTLIRLVPLHGAHNISLLATSEIVWQMGIPIGVLTDGTNVDRVRRGEHSSHIEKLVGRMLREAEAEGRTVDAFGLSLDDVLFYLDDDVTATFAKEGFPGWIGARAIWNVIDQPTNITSNGSKFKEWITSTYGLPLDRDSVRNIAKRCKEVGMIPEELSEVVAEIVSKTL